jgi:hypothetical protein
MLEDASLPFSLSLLYASVCVGTHYVRLYMCWRRTHLSLCMCPYSMPLFVSSFRDILCVLTTCICIHVVLFCYICVRLYVCWRTHFSLLSTCVLTLSSVGICLHSVRLCLCWRTHLFLYMCPYSMPLYCKYMLEDASLSLYMSFSDAFIHFVFFFFFLHSLFVHVFLSYAFIPFFSPFYDVCVSEHLYMLEDLSLSLYMSLCYAPL